MNFCSIEYLLFIPLVFLCLIVSPKRLHWLVFLIGSWYFYLTLKHLDLLLVLLIVSIITYSCGILLDQHRNERWRRAIFLGGVSTNVVVLIGMKYLPFLINNLNALFRWISIGTVIREITPIIAIGVSYFVFQAISYLIDIYLDVIKPERHLGIFALYLGFFPKLLQGPIERAENLLPQLRVSFNFDQDNFRVGLLTFLWGFFKKAVVADRLALYVNAAYGDLSSHAGLPLLFATYLYALQIYYDFSGYTDMALGSARMFNLRLTQNFRYPYLATSVADFWRRWHISFSRWILDYIFKPLQFQWRDKRQAGTAAALIVTFLICGLWHGASWCFIIWGGLHGLYLATGIYYRPLQKKLYIRLRIENSSWLALWQIFVTFNLICFAWIFFRAKTVQDAMYVLTHLVAGDNSLSSFLLAYGKTNLLIVMFSLILIWIIYWIKEKTKLSLQFFSAPIWCRWSVYFALATLLLLFNTDNNVGYIYFRF